jgi:hypothetical protein
MKKSISKIQNKNKHTVVIIEARRYEVSSSPSVAACASAFP